MADWQEIPTHWLRRTCARARRICEWIPKTSEIIRIFHALKNERREKIFALKKKRQAIVHRMSDDELSTFLRDAYRRMGRDYDKEKKRERLFKELQSRKQKLEAA